MSTGFLIFASLMMLLVTGLLGTDKRYRYRRIPLNGEEKRGRILRILVFGGQVGLVLYFIYWADLRSLPSWWMDLTRWSQSTFLSARQLVGRSIVYREAIPSIYLSTLVFGLAYFLVGLCYFSERATERYPVLKHPFGVLTAWLWVTMFMLNHTVSLVESSPYYHRYDDVIHSDWRYSNNIVGLLIANVMIWFVALDLLAKLFHLHWKQTKNIFFDTPSDPERNA